MMNVSEPFLSYQRPTFLPTIMSCHSVSSGDEISAQKNEKTSTLGT